MAQYNIATSSLDWLPCMSTAIYCKFTCSWVRSSNDPTTKTKLTQTSCGLLPKMLRKCFTDDTCTNPDTHTYKIYIYTTVCFAPLTGQVTGVSRLHSLPMLYCCIAVRVYCALLLECNTYHLVDIFCFHYKILMRK